jgi:tRNA(Ser,Leu) C12 N-acetylase TAN1
MKLDPERPCNIQIIQKEILIQILNKESLIDKLKKRKENSHFSKRVSI